MRERDRVGSARQRDDHASIAPRKVMSSDRPPDAIEQLHNLGARGGWKGRRGGMVQRRMISLPAAHSCRSSLSRLSCPNVVPEGGLEPPTPRL